MAIVIIRQDGKHDSWKKALQAKAPDYQFYTFQENHPREAITMAIVWKHPPGSLDGYPNLKCISSFGAGVDFIMEEENLPANVPITRVVDEMLAGDMSEFVLAQMLVYLKNLKVYALDQEKQLWKPREYRRLADLKVGIMGVGALGAVLAADLLKLGCKVRGWVTTDRGNYPIPIFAGEDKLGAFLQGLDILVCLLPLTDKTRGILNRALFSQLPKGAFVINVARGGHLVDEDLLYALNSGQLSGAALDVFHEEPLPKGHPFWGRPDIHVTPHIASVSDQDSIIPQLLENYRRLMAGETLINVVSREKGY